jgi:hypothetical protein
MNETMMLAPCWKALFIEAVKVFQKSVTLKLYCETFSTGSTTDFTFCFFFFSSLLLTTFVYSLDIGVWADKMSSKELATRLARQIVSPSKGQKGRRGFVGMEVTEQPPFIVLEVDHLLDKNYIQQGHAEYANEMLQPGDKLVRVDGTGVESVTATRLHELLCGDMHSLADLSFLRGQGGEEYTIQVRRHGSHENKRKPANVPSTSRPRALGSPHTASSKLMPDDVTKSSSASSLRESPCPQEGQPAQAGFGILLQV